jgi:hypothetical protein
MANLNATDDFYNAIKEVQLLLKYAARNQRNVPKYRTFNKAATVLLCAKFESFIENFLDEYAFELIRKTTNKTLCEELLEHIIDDIIEHLETAKSDKTKRRKYIDKIAYICSANENTDLETYREHINSKLKIGKHGQNEIQRLLKKFGFNSILESSSMYAFFQQFNSLNSIRNNIVHEDATPSLTHTDVQNYLSIIDVFVKEIQTKATEMLSSV